ncbi:MAG: DUF2764 family protein [Chlamydiales bacterium]|nr:DUF2764 family protein [Chlamydiales bacterium]
MDKYPFIISCLPEIRIGAKPEISFQEVLDLLSLNCSSQDQKRVSQLLLLVDIDNIKAFWLGLPLNSAGTMSAKEIEEALLVEDFLPPFFIDFLDRYETTEERLAHFPAVYVSVYEQMEGEAEGLVRDYYSIERQLRLVLAALRAKALGRDLVREFQFEDVHDPFVMQILVQKDAADYTAPQEYQLLQEIFEKYRSDPMELYRSLLEYRFQKIMELEEQYQPFTMDRILGFLARLMIVEMWSQLDTPKGLSFIDDLSKNG